MKKLIDLEDKTKTKMENELEAEASKLGMDSWESVRGTSILEDRIGLCAKCKRLNYCRTEFDNIFASCSEFEFKLSGQNRVVECNEFSPRGSLSLIDMFGIATIIELNDRKVGF